MPERIVNTKYYEFYQNNSGGSYVQNDEVDCLVFIEATSAAEANSKFDSLDNDSGNYCDCCGVRWTEAWEEDGHETPYTYSGKPLSEYNFYEKDGYAIIYHMTGQVERIPIGERSRKKALDASVDS